MKLLFSLLFCSIYINLYCQITLVDNHNLPIPSVELYSDRQGLLGQSDNQGIVRWDKLQNQKLNDTIYFHHLNYNSKWIISKDLERNDTVRLTAINHQLSEVVVTSDKTNKNSKKYQSINACFRSYQTNNDSIIYYTDGQVNYLTKATKLNYKRKLTQYRSYKDSTYISERKKRKVVFATAGIPYLGAQYLPEKYFKSNNLKLSENIDGSVENSH